MANYSSVNLKLELKDSGGTYRDISNFVRASTLLEIEAMLEESHAYGDDWQEFLSTGFNKWSPFTIDGHYDDASNTPSSLWSKGATRLMKITWDATPASGAPSAPAARTTIISVIMTKYKRTVNMEKLHTYTMTLQPVGPPTES